MHVLFYLSILFRIFLTPPTMTLPSSYSSSKQNDSPPHQQRRKHLIWRCAAALVLPSGSHHGARRTSAVYSMAACLDHHRCKASVHSNDSHLGADIPLLQTWPARCQALTVSWDSDARMRRCKSGTFLFLFGEKELKKISSSKLDANCKTHPRPWKS